MARQRHKWDPVCTWPAGLVRPVRIDPTGRVGPTRGQRMGPGWRKSPGRGWFVPAYVDRSVPEQRILEESVRLQSGGAVTGWASLRVHGGNFFDGLARDGVTELPVDLCVGPLTCLRGTPATRVYREQLPAHEIVMLHGIPCTERRRALFDAMRTAPSVLEAVVAMDMAAAAELVSISQMWEYVERHPGWRGVEQVRTALSYADENSRSPNETRTSWIWEVQAGFPRLLRNRPVFDLRGNLLGYADLLDTEAGVVGEFDGADHRGALRHSKDVDREGRFRNHDLEFFRVTGPDLLVPSRVVDRMRSTRARAKWVPEGQRTWTLELPPGWEPEMSLDELFAYREMIHRPADGFPPTG